jgi:hypothetical protein
MFDSPHRGRIGNTNGLACLACLRKEQYVEPEPSCIVHCPANPATRTPDQSPPRPLRADSSALPIRKPADQPMTPQPGAVKGQASDQHTMVKSYQQVHRPVR